MADFSTGFGGGAVVVQAARRTRSTAKCFMENDYHAGNAERRRKRRRKSKSIASSLCFSPPPRVLRVITFPVSPQPHADKAKEPQARAPIHPHSGNSRGWPPASVREEVPIHS